MLKENINSALRQALRERQELKLSVFRMLSAAVHNKEIEKRTRFGGGPEVSLTDEEIIGVIRAEVKKRHDAAEAYARGGRPDVAEREQSEAAILEAFLPQELSAAELDGLVAEGVATLGVNSPRDFGKVMGWVMERVRGRASGERVAEFVRQRITSS